MKNITITTSTALMLLGILLIPSLSSASQQQNALAQVQQSPQSIFIIISSKDVCSR
jgi:hypothetical protein